MRVERRHRHARLGEPCHLQRLVGQPRRRLDAVLGDIFGNVGQRDMAGNARGPQRAQRVELAEIVRHAEIIGEEVQLVLEIHAAFLHRLLVQRREAYGVGIAALHRVQAGGQRLARAAPGGRRHLAGGDIGLRHGFHRQEERAIPVAGFFPVGNRFEGRGGTRHALAFLPHPEIADHHHAGDIFRIGPRQQPGDQFGADAAGIAKGHSDDGLFHGFTGRDAR